MNKIAASISSAVCSKNIAPFIEIFPFFLYNTTMEKGKLKTIITLGASLITIIIFFTGIRHFDQLVKFFGFSKTSNVKPAEGAKQETEVGKKGGKPLEEAKQETEPDLRSVKPVKRANQETKPNLIKRKKKELYWDFDSGDLRGLTLDNVRLKRFGDNQGFYLEFFHKYNESSLQINETVCFPWTFCFNSYFVNYRWIGIEFLKSNKIYFTVRIYYDDREVEFHCLEDRRLVFMDNWNFGNSWNKWRIEALRTGQILIYIDEKVFFKYFLRKFEQNMETTIKITCSEDPDCRIDNLLLKGVSCN